MPIRLTPYFLEAMEDKTKVKKATIKVEKTKGPVLLVSGQDDQMWPSSLFSDMIVKRLAENNHPYQFRHISYRGAGHTIRPDFMPRTFTVMRHPITKILYELGGSAKENAFASADSWSKTLDFLNESLSRKQ
jgi:dienelactone hydrolase